MAETLDIAQWLAIVSIFTLQCKGLHRGDCAVWCRSFGVSITTATVRRIPLSEATLAHLQGAQDQIPFPSSRSPKTQQTVTATSWPFWRVGAPPAPGFFNDLVDR
jgi:hypothetical protein